MRTNRSLLCVIPCIVIASLLLTEYEGSGDAWLVYGPGKDGQVYVTTSVEGCHPYALRAFDKAGRLLWEIPMTGLPLSAQFTHTGKLIFITVSKKAIHK